MVLWITLPHAWKLQDIQAALNVIITGCSGLGIFLFTRCCWQIGARSVVKKGIVASSSLLTLNTLGEALESLVLLRSNIILHVKIALQCFAVVIFSLMTLFSGPIARYSTQVTTTVVHARVDGLLAGRTDNSMADAQVTWNLTQTSLNQAGFPMNQLLDYMPNPANAWIYHPEEWNNSWSMACESTELTPVDLILTDNCTTFTSKFGSAIESEIFPPGINSYYYKYASSDYYVNSTFVKDLLVFLYAANYSDYEQISDTYLTVEMAIGYLHVHGLPKNDSDAFDSCRYGEGAVASASYTRVDCLLTRSHARLQDASRVAYPDSGDVGGIPSAFLSNYFQRFKQESMRNNEISIITPQDLLRFYQTYTVSKDTQIIRPVERQMSVQVPAVQISTIFVAIFALLLLFIILSGATYALFWFWHPTILQHVPQSKLDWLIYSIILTPTPHDYTSGQNQVLAVPMAHENYMQRTNRRRAQFEAAIYDAAYVGRTSSPVVQNVVNSPLKMA
jgi:hypothetical protein